MEKRPSVSVKKLSDIPQESGVYFFINKEKEVMYVGKATNLRSRVRSYFAGDMLKKRGPLIEQMIPNIHKVQYEVTESALEALILEANYIKKLQPPHNTRDKSDRSFVFLLITKEEYPRLIIKRQRELQEGKVKEPIKYSFGPYTSRHTLEQALKIVRKIFPFYSRKRSYDEKSNVYQQIGLAPGGGVTPKEYAENIQHIKLFFDGKKQRVIKQLEKSMMAYAKVENFEKANEIKKRLFALQHIRDSSLITDDNSHKRYTNYRVEAYDVAHLQGKHAVGVMTVLYDGQVEKTAYRKFKIKSFNGIDDNRALLELLERRFKHTEWEYPSLIVADGSVAQKRTVERFLNSREDLSGIRVVACKKDEHHKVAEVLGDSAVIKKYRTAILLSNSEAHRFAITYHKQIRDKAFLAKK